MGLFRKIEAALTDTEDNLEALSRDEYIKLKRQLKIMENDKRAYLRESLGSIQAQKLLLDSLGIELKEIRDGIHVFNNEKSERDENGIKDELKCLIIKYRENESNIEKQELKYNRTNEGVYELIESVDELNQCVGRKEREESEINQIKNKIFIAKMKLETVTGKFDGVVAKNSESRDCIDEVLQENILLRDRLTTIELQVGNSAKEIDNLVDDSNNAYDQREDAVNRCSNLLERNSKEKKQNNLEMSELNRIIRHEQKLYNFMNSKNRERIFLETETERLSRLELAKEKLTDDALESYRENFNKLLKDGSRNLNDLVHEYSRLYNTNIKTFSYINQINGDLEFLQNDVINLREEIKRVSRETIERNTQKNKLIIQKQFEIDELNRELINISFKLDKMDISMNEISNWIQNLFRMTEYSRKAPVLQLLGVKGEISIGNILLYMNILEDRLNEILGVSQLIRMESPSTETSKSILNLQSSSTITTQKQLQLKLMDSIDNTYEYDLVAKELDPLAYAQIRNKIKNESDSQSNK